MSESDEDLDKITCNCDQASKDTDGCCPSDGPTCQDAAVRLHLQRLFRQDDLVTNLMPMAIQGMPSKKSVTIRKPTIEEGVSSKESTFSKNSGVGSTKATGSIYSTRSLPEDENERLIALLNSMPSVHSKHSNVSIRQCQTCKRTAASLDVKMPASRKTTLNDNEIQEYDTRLDDEKLNNRMSTRSKKSRASDTNAPKTSRKTTTSIGTVQSKRSHCPSYGTISSLPKRISTRKPTVRDEDIQRSDVTNNECVECCAETRKSRASRSSTKASASARQKIMPQESIGGEEIDEINVSTSNGSEIMLGSTSRADDRAYDEAKTIRPSTVSKKSKSTYPRDILLKSASLALSKRSQCPSFSVQNKRSSRKPTYANDDVQIKKSITPTTSNKSRSIASQYLQETVYDGKITDAEVLSTGTKGSKRSERSKVSVSSRKATTTNINRETVQLGNAIFPSKPSENAPAVCEKCCENRTVRNLSPEKGKKPSNIDRITLGTNGGSTTETQTRKIPIELTENYTSEGNNAVHVSTYSVIVQDNDGKEKRSTKNLKSRIVEKINNKPECCENSAKVIEEYFQNQKQSKESSPLQNNKSESSRGTNDPAAKATNDTAKTNGDVTNPNEYAAKSKECAANSEGCTYSQQTIPADHGEFEDGKSDNPTMEDKSDENDDTSINTTDHEPLRGGSDMLLFNSGSNEQSSHFNRDMAHHYQEVINEDTGGSSTPTSSSDKLTEQSLEAESVDGEIEDLPQELNNQKLILNADTLPSTLQVSDNEELIKQASYGDPQQNHQQVQYIENGIQQLVTNEDTDLRVKSSTIIEDKESHDEKQMLVKKNEELPIQQHPSTGSHVSDGTSLNSSAEPRMHPQSTNSNDQSYIQPLISNAGMEKYIEQLIEECVEQGIQQQINEDPEQGNQQVQFNEVSEDKDQLVTDEDVDVHVKSSPNNVDKDTHSETQHIQPPSAGSRVCDGKTDCCILHSEYDVYKLQAKCDACGKREMRYYSACAAPPSEQK